MIVKSEKKSVAKKRHLYSGEKGEGYFLEKPRKIHFSEKKGGLGWFGERSISERSEQ